MYPYDISHFANKWKRDCIFLSTVDVFLGVTQFFTLSFIAFSDQTFHIFPRVAENREAQPTALWPIHIITGLVIRRRDCTFNGFIYSMTWVLHYIIDCYLCQTPADKLQCAVRCASIIMNLLSMANEKSVPAADDFMPVLIYILIKANPPCLLSTVQYVSSFYEKRLCGAEQYWWTQLTSAIEFIKTMDYPS